MVVAAVDVPAGAALTFDMITQRSVPEQFVDSRMVKPDSASYVIGQKMEGPLKAGNILYDREGSAEFFQFYTQDFEDKFFFEIVERRGYKGFGAPNAPIRIAAQTRLARHPAIPRR